MTKAIKWKSTPITKCWDYEAKAYGYDLIIAQRRGLWNAEVYETRNHQDFMMNMKRGFPTARAAKDWAEQNARALFQSVEGLAI